MKRILLVDDDQVVLRMYLDGLSQAEMEVSTASDGLAAIQALRAKKPDLVVLDLMMPRFTGVDVLKFIRSEADFKTLPVIVLSNSYMNALAGEAAQLGVQKAMLKISCSPVILLRAIDNILAGRTTTEDRSLLLAAPTPPAPEPEATSPARAGLRAPPRAMRHASSPAPESPTAFQNNARTHLLEDAQATCSALRSLCQAFTNAPNDRDRELRLQNLYRKVHFVSATAALAGCLPLAQMATAFEALLFELADKPKGLTPSVLRTIAGTIDFLALLFDCAREADFDVPPLPQALVVDDDKLNNRIVVSALQRAHLEARATDDALVGLQMLKERRFDLVLLDIEMPGMDGFELCRRLRQLQGYQKTPVIYVTSHTDFDTRTKSVLSGGDDMISKPVFPMELAVKAVSLLLKRQMGARRT